MSIRNAGVWLAGAMAALGLAGCDEGTIITHLDATTKLTKSRISSAAAGGFPVEVHGAPFPGIEPYQVAGVLAFPQSWHGGGAFRDVAPGAPDAQHSARLVLVFGGGAPNASHHCRQSAPMETAPPSEVGFSVHAVFCTGETAFGSGFMKAPKVTGDDATGFRRAMRQLLRTILEQADENRV